MDKIVIAGASFPCRVGISKQERRRKQQIKVDVEIFCDTRKAASQDDLRATVSYLEVHDCLREITQREEHHLIETIAEQIAASILEKFKVPKVLVRVKKPGALVKQNVEYAAVEIVRERNG